MDLSIAKKVFEALSFSSLLSKHLYILLGIFRDGPKCYVKIIYILHLHKYINLCKQIQKFVGSFQDKLLQ